jgi:hypothetical protein
LAEIATRKTTAESGGRPRPLRKKGIGGFISFSGLFSLIMLAQRTDNARNGWRVPNDERPHFVNKMPCGVF